jgi:hypothetical protein
MMQSSYRSISPERHAENEDITRTALQLAKDAERDTNNFRADRLESEVKALGPLTLVSPKVYADAMKKLMFALRLRRG